MCNKVNVPSRATGHAERTHSKCRIGLRGLLCGFIHDGTLFDPQYDNFQFSIFNFQLK
jgi:hypothetical protein